MKRTVAPSTLPFPTPVFIVGTYCRDGMPNAMNVAWGGVCSSSPVCIAISIRKERCTYENILLRKCFTINIPSIKYLRESDYMGLISGNKENKFHTANLTAKHGTHVDAPNIREFPVNIECKFHSSQEIGEHIHIIGKVVSIHVDENGINMKGEPDMELIAPFCYDPATNQYVCANRYLAKAFSVGKPLMKSK